ncbi:MAG: glycosyl transferase family 1 [Acidobacteria bacterium]|nr:MAG: glycosyl transferase family 1 [Acidobacteriota bacterium]
MTESRPIADNRAICITLENLPSPTETFINNHIQNLPSRILVVEGWRQKLDGRLVLSLPRRVFYKFLRIVSSSSLKREQTAAYTKVYLENNVSAVLAEYGTAGTLTTEACARLGIPLIVYFFGYDATLRSVLEEYSEAYRVMFREAASLVAVSRSIKARLVSLGAPPDKVHVIPCGVDCDQFASGSPAQSEPLFLAVGRFTEKKGPQFTIKAFAKTHAAYPAARLRMIGDGPLLEECKNLAKSLDLDGLIEFSGSLPHSELHDAMQQARCFVQHSIEASSGDCEGTPVAILEAGASGLPVISTRHAGIPDVVIEGETGFLVDERDFEGMAEHMILLAQDPVLAQRMGEAARRRIADNFSIEGTTLRLWQVIESCMNGNKRVAS